MPNVEIDTQTVCPSGWRAKTVRESKGVAYQEIAVEVGGGLKQAMVQRASGRTTVPQIFIGERHVGGCDDLMALDRAGKLDELLAA